MKHERIRALYAKWERQNQKIKLTFAVCAAAVLCILVLVTVGAIRESERRVILSGTAQLEKAIQIGELSTSQFTCNGIAEVCDPEDTEKVYCYVCYESQVKVGLHMDRVKFEIDIDEGILRIILPPVEIMSTSVNPASLDYMQKESGLELQDVLSACVRDVEEVAQESDALFQMARENAISSITALIYSLVEQSGYEIVWEGARGNEEDFLRVDLPDSVLEPPFRLWITGKRDILQPPCHL